MDRRFGFPVRGKSDRASFFATRCRRGNGPAKMTVELVGDAAVVFRFNKIFPQIDFHFVWSFISWLQAMPLILLFLRSSVASEVTIRTVIAFLQIRVGV